MTGIAFDARRSRIGALTRLLISLSQRLCDLETLASQAGIRGSLSTPR
jgi:hypothetical protein